LFNIADAMTQLVPLYTIISAYNEFMNLFVTN